MFNRRLGAATLGVVMLGSLLTACTPVPDEDGTATFSANPTARAFEEPVGDGGEDVTTNEEEVAQQGLVTDMGENNKTEITKANDLLLAAATYMEENKVDGGYDEWLYYASNPQDSVRMRLLPQLSSSESYCIAAISGVDPSLAMFYDSQTDKVLADGEACKKPLGEPWGTGDISEMMDEDSVEDGG